MFKDMLQYCTCAVFMCAIGFFALSACQAHNPHSPSAAKRPEIVEAQPGILKSYDAFFVGDIEVLALEGDVLRRVSTQDVENLADLFRRKLIHQLGSRHTMFPQPAKRVAKMRISLTDVSSTYTAFQIVPGMAVPNALRGGASIEAKVLDSVSNKVILTFRDSRQGERQDYFSSLRKWDGVEKAFDEWAQQLSTAIRR